MASGRAIDHVVLVVKNLERAAETYQGLGFTLTPRAAHEDRMGTSNRLAQFRGRNFIELLEVDRPDKLARHDFAVSPPFFSFGDHNRLAVAEREGLSMVAFATDDARADMERFSAAGIPVSAAFDFQRAATLPDGSQVIVAFSLVFVRFPEMPKIGFFVSESRAPQHFWKPAYQSHANGSEGIVAVYLSSPDPDRDAQSIGALFGGAVERASWGLKVACGPSQEFRVLTPQAMAQKYNPLEAGETASVLSGIALAAKEKRAFTPASQAKGMFIDWTATTEIN